MSTASHRYAVRLVAGLLITATAPAALARDLTVVSWGGNFQQAQNVIDIAPFQKQLGKPILQESWDGGIGVLQAKVKAGVPNWDVVLVEAEDLEQGCTDGLYEKIDWANVDGKSSFIPQAVSECSVGAIVWSHGMVYDASKLKAGPTSWADFWDTRKFPGKRGLRKTPKYALEFALLADGVKPDKLYATLRTKEGVDRAFKKLDELKPNIIWWSTAANAIQLLAAGQVVMTTAPNGRIAGINRSEKTHFQFVWPGSIYSVDSWAILKGAPNKDDGMKFIAFASKPENQAKLPEYIAYGPTNKAAQPMVAAAYRDDLPTAPANASMTIHQDADFWTDNIAALTQRFNAWLAQ